MTLAIQDELVARATEAERLRQMQVERAQYEADLAQRRYLRVDPDNRLVAGALLTSA
jgi:FAD/FMN-containing dehydrogenase